MSTLDEYERIKHLNSDQFRTFLVQTVQLFPCLWNRNLPEHRSLNVLADGWRQVANIVGNGLTARECQFKWRTIRNNYTAHLRRGYPGETYLNGTMEFVRPFTICGREPNGTEDFGSDYEESNDGQDQVMVVEVPDDYEVTTSGYYEEDSSNLDDAPAACQHVRIDSSDGDALFLLSMLPEMEAMNEEQKQAFKNTVLALSEQFLN